MHGTCDAPRTTHRPRPASVTPATTTATTKAEEGAIKPPKRRERRRLIHSSRLVIDHLKLADWLVVVRVVVVYILDPAAAEIFRIVDRA